MERRFNCPCEVRVLDAKRVKELIGRVVTLSHHNMEYYFIDPLPDTSDNLVRASNGFVVPKTDLSVEAIDKGTTGSMTDDINFTEVVDKLKEVNEKLSLRGAYDVGYYVCVNTLLKDVKVGDEVNSIEDKYADWVRNERDDDEEDQGYEWVQGFEEAKDMLVRIFSGYDNSITPLINGKKTKIKLYEPRT